MNKQTSYLTRTTTVDSIQVSSGINIPFAVIAHDVTQVNNGIQYRSNNNCMSCWTKQEIEIGLVLAHILLSLVLLYHYVISILDNF